MFRTTQLVASRGKWVPRSTHSKLSDPSTKPRLPTWRGWLMRSRWHSRGRGLYSQIHRGTGQDKVMQWLLAAGELKDAYLKGKIAYFISLGITSLRWLICTIKSTDMNWASAIRCWAVCWVQQYKSEWATVLAVQYWHPCRVSRNENRRGKQERSIISLGDSRNRGKGAYLQFRKTTRWRCENPQQEEASTMVEQRGLKVAMKAMVVFIRKTSMGSGSNKGGRAAGGALLASTVPGNCWRWCRRVR